MTVLQYRMGGWTQHRAVCSTKLLSPGISDMIRCSNQIRNSRYRDFFIILPVIAVFFSLLCLSAMEIIPGDPGEFILAGAMVAPFVILALLAYAGEQNRFARIPGSALASLPSPLHLCGQPGTHPRTGCCILRRPGCLRKLPGFAPGGNRSGISCYSRFVPGSSA